MQGYHCCVLAPRLAFQPSELRFTRQYPLPSGWIQEELQRELTKPTAIEALQDECGDITAGITDDIQDYTRHSSIPCYMRENIMRKMSQRVSENSVLASQVDAVSAISIDLSGQTPSRIVLYKFQATGAGCVLTLFTPALAAKYQGPTIRIGDPDP